MTIEWSAVDFYKRDHEALIEDTRRAETYLRHYQEMRQWPRLGEIADILRAWQDVTPNGTSVAADSDDPKNGGSKPEEQ